MNPTMEHRLTQLVQLSFGFLLILPALVPAARFLQDPDHARIVNLLYDDTYYYLQIAHQLAFRGLSSFDGVTLTNGYQPLWALMLTLLAKLTGPDKTVFFAGAVALTHLLSLYILVQAPRLSRHIGISPFYGTLLFAYILLQCNTIYTRGLETVLTPFFILYLLFRLTRPDQMLERPLALGLVFAFAFLVRLDAAAVAPAYLLLDWVLNRRGLGFPYILRVARIMLPLLITGGVYAGLNHHWFGSAVPVSGLAKAMDTGRFNNFGIIHNYLQSCLPLLPSRSEVLPFVFWGGALLVEMVRRTITGPLRTGGLPLAFLLLCALIQYAYYASFSGWNIWPWYLYFTPFILFFVVVRTIASLMALIRHWRTPASTDSATTTIALSNPKPQLAVALVALVMTGLFSGIDKLRAGLQTADAKRMTYGKLSLQQCPLVEGKTVAFGDRAGSLGYWCNVSVVQTEGLVMSREFLQARIDNQGERWLDEHYNIDLYMVDRTRIPTRTGDPDVFVLVDPIQGRTAHRTQLRYCFPATALLDRQDYAPDASRFIFDYRQKIPCTAEDDRIIADIQTQEGLRRYSLPAEYRNQPLKRWLENLDRRLAGLN